MPDGVSRRGVLQGAAALAISGMMSRFAWAADAVTTAPAPAGPALPAGHRFTHPGLLSNLAELEFVRKQVREGKEPWKTAFARLQADSVAKLDYRTEAVAVVDCRVDKPDFDKKGTDAQNNAGHSAYAHALQWFILQKPEHARKVIEILNDWSATLKDHTGLNRGLQTGWMAPVFCRAAEIVRYTSDLWPAAEVERFSGMLRNVWLPMVISGADRTAGNWDLSFAEGVLSIGAFTEDVQTVNRGVRMIDRRIPLYFYLESDGPLPRVPTPEPGRQYAGWEMKGYQDLATEAGVRKYWYRLPGDGKFYDGQCQETCRDLLHCQMGMAAAANCMEIALHQGVDLYTPHQERLTRGMEYLADFLLGAPVPKDLRGGELKFVDKREQAWEILYSRYAVQRGANLPKSRQIVEQHRAKVPFRKLHMAWETLTHGDLERVAF